MGLPSYRDFIKNHLEQANFLLSQELTADVLIVSAEIKSGLDDAIRRALSNPSKKNLAVILQTPGGSIEIVERIHHIFRAHYEEVYFIIPNYAYSAGTVLAMSGDEIYMDYYSVLGPIDPQIQNNKGEYVPALSYLHHYYNLIKQINEVENKDTVYAEILMLKQLYDPSLIFIIEQNIEFAQELIRGWLPQYKFKDWDYTETNINTVTEGLKINRAHDIAKTLGDAATWHSHGRGITLSTLQSDFIKLKIQDLSKNPTLAKLVHNYFDDLNDFCKEIGYSDFLHSKNGLWRL
jgi:hypothetical protein